MMNYIYDLKGYFAERGKKLITIWSAGEEGEKCADQLRKQGFDFAFFIDSDSKKEFNYVLNKVVFTPKILDSFNKKDVFIFVANNRYYAEIANTLTEKGFIENEDFFELPNNYSSFIYKSNQIINYVKKLDEIPLFSKIEIETINRCNGKCSFCPVNARDDTREKVVMSEELFYSIISQLKELNYSKYIQLQSNNEPFLDSRMESFIIHTRKELPNAYLNAQTNGTLLTLEKFKTVIEYLDFIVIDNYRDDFEFNKNTKDIYEYSKNSEELRKKVRICKRMETEVLHSRGGTSPNAPLINCQGGTCIYPFVQAIVRPSGEMSLCCCDALGQITLGDLKQESLVQIWNGKKYTEIRKNILQGREFISICKVCSNFPGLGTFRDIREGNFNENKFLVTGLFNML